PARYNTSGIMRFPHSRAVLLSALAVAILAPLFAVLVVAQTQRRAAAPPPAPPYDAAMRSFVEGRFDDLDAQVEKLNANDPNVVALKARGMIARGKYADAEALLQPVAVRVPTSEAALQLGLLQQTLGRPGAAQTLTRVTDLIDTTRSAVEIARAARALQALGRFREANDAYRIAAGSAPANADIQTQWGDLFLEKYNNAEAIKSYQAAFEIDPRWVPALLGAAHALADDNPPQAQPMIKRVLQINPKSVDAQIFLASQSADVDKRKDAREALKRALEVN